MKIFFVNFYFLLFSLCLPLEGILRNTLTRSQYTRAQEFAHNCHRYFLNRSITYRKSYIDNKLALLREHSINEPGFPMLSEQFKQRHRAVIDDVIKTVDLLLRDMNDYYGCVSSTIETEIRNGRTTSKIWHGSEFLTFEDDGMLYALNLNYRFMLFHETGTLRTYFFQPQQPRGSILNDQEINRKMDQILEPYQQNIENSEEEEFCLTCYGGSVDSKLKCCGKLQHKHCLYRWWSQQSSHVVLKCPHCQRIVEH